MKNVPLQRRFHTYRALYKAAKCHGKRRDAYSTVTMPPRCHLLSRARLSKPRERNEILLYRWIGNAHMSDFGTENTDEIDLRE